MTHRVGSHLAEKVVEVASPILFNQIYVSHFRGRLKELATHQFAHFVVARLALSAHTSEEAGMIAAEVRSHRPPPSPTCRAPAVSLADVVRI